MMDAQELDRLFAAFLDGSLDDAGTQRLLEAVRTDPQALQQLCELQEIDIAAEALARTGEDRRRLADQIMLSIADKGRRERLADAVLEDVRNKKPSTRRLPRLRPGRPSPEKSVVVWVAAGLLLGVILILIPSSPPSQPRALSKTAPPATEPASPAAVREPKRPEPQEEKKPAETTRQEVPPRKTEEERAKTPDRTDPKPLPPAPAPVLPDTRPQTIEASLAKIVRVDGQVSILAAGKKSPATAAQELRGGPGLQTGPVSALVIEYPDGTQLELGSDTSIRELTDGPLGKRVELTRGVLSAVVTQQPEGRPLAISTPHGTATVLGTTLRLRVESLSTRLDVSEGNVLLKRTDGKSVEVLAGTYAVAAVGVDLAVRRILDGKEPVFIEVEEFGTAREAKPTNGPTWKLYLETDPGASAGHLVVAPSAGAEVTGEMDFVKGRWYLWVRYRNEESAAPVTFQVLAGGKVIGQAATSPGGQNYLWKRFEFTATGPTRIGLRSTFKGIPDPAVPLTPFDSVNRWDRICLVRDEDFIPK